MKVIKFHDVAKKCDGKSVLRHELIFHQPTILILGGVKIETVLGIYWSHAHYYLPDGKRSQNWVEILEHPFVVMIP